MYKYYNPNPSGKISDDCVKRAICVCTGSDYGVISRQLNAFRRVSGAKRFNTENNPHLFVEDVLDGIKIVVEGKMTAEQFCHTYQNGRYILDMDEHWSACVDGVIYDTWDCRGQQVNFAYKIMSDEYVSPDLKNQTFKYCCTTENINNDKTLICIYDGNGACTRRVVPKKLVEGYVLCLQDRNYYHIEL